MTVEDMKKEHYDRLKCSASFEEYQEYLKYIEETVNKAKTITVNNDNWKDAWVQWLKLYGKELAEKQGVYDPEEDEIEVIPVPDEESNIWTVHINVKKGKAIEIVQFDFIIKEQDSNLLDIAKEI